MQELESLRQHGVCIVIDRAMAAGSSVIIKKWVYTVKKDQNGYVERFKARLVVHGYKRISVRYDVSRNLLRSPAPVVDSAV